MQTPLEAAQEGEGEVGEVVEVVGEGEAGEGEAGEGEVGEGEAGRTVSNLRNHECFFLFQLEGT